MKSTNSMNLSFKRIPRRKTIAIASFILGILATIIYYSMRNGMPGSVEIVQPEPTPYEIKRLKGYKNIQPVVSVESKVESEKLAPLKSELNQLLDSLKQAGTLSDASIYLKHLNKGYWMSINSDLRFHPASLMKVPLMLAVLKTVEADPSTLGKKITHHHQDGKVMLPQHFQGKAIQEDKTYTLHELLYYCIAESDNHATHALETNIDLQNVINLFGDIDLPIPDLHNNDYTITAGEYSSFISAIYFSAFISPELSEYASELMANSSFKAGISSGLPTGTKSWRKFGEWSRPGQAVELHESGVVYVDGRPFLLTVMTKGKDLDGLSKVLGHIAKIVYSRTSKMEFGTSSSKSCPVFVLKDYQNGCQEYL